MFLKTLAKLVNIQGSRSKANNWGDKLLQLLVNQANKNKLFSHQILHKNNHSLGPHHRSFGCLHGAAPRGLESSSKYPLLGDRQHDTARMTQS